MYHSSRRVRLSIVFLFTLLLAGLMLVLLAGPRAAAQPIIADTGLLTRLGHLGGETRGLCQTDDYVYMGMGAELLVFDAATITDTQHPDRPLDAPRPDRGHRRRRRPAGRCGRERRRALRFGE